MFPKDLLVSHHGAHAHGPAEEHEHHHHHDFNLKGIADHWGHQKTGGKIGIVAGGTVALGVMLHGGLNIKRGLTGYDDTQTGVHKKASLENLLFGVGETYVGLTMLRRFLTGNTSWAMWK